MPKLHANETPLAAAAVPRVQSFPSASELQTWLEANHTTASEIWLRLRKKGVAGPGVTYAEALDLALCFGWIDGVWHSIDTCSFAIRFTPRKPRSIWSLVNLRHYERLQRLGRVTPAGREVFEKRDPKRSGLYSFESRPQEFSSEYCRLLQANAAAWAFFSAQPPYYRRVATFWVVSAKREPTRERRLAQLISDSAQQQRLRMLAPAPKRKPA